MSENTPLMEQYNQIKKNYPETILMFRIGDFYEMFNEDAKIASRILNIVLTTKPFSKNQRIPLAGVPYHAVDTHINSLIKKGYKVAICEQVEDPKLAKGIVKREVVRVITPGTILSSTLLEEKSNNFLVAIEIDKEIGFAYVDLSTGEFSMAEFISLKELINELIRLQPAECLLPEKLQEVKSLLEKEIPKMSITTIPDWDFNYETTYLQLTKHFKIQSLDGFGLKDYKNGIICSGVIIKYLKETQKQAIAHIIQLKPYSSSEFLILDSTALNDLEVVKTIGTGEKQNSLLWFLDETVTSMGGRMLKNWVLFPLIDLKKIILRQDAIEEFINQKNFMYRLRDSLKEICDIERIIGKLGCGTANARELVALKNSLEFIPKIKELLSSATSKKLKELQLDELKDIYQLIDEAISDQPPLSLKEGRLIKKGYHKEVDELLEIISGGKNWIVQFEASEKEKTRINSLKVRHNRIFGYYIEITNANLQLVPTNYTRKQTLVNAERFITTELKEYEEKVLTAEEQIVEIEYQLFQEICYQIMQKVEQIQKLAKALAELDCLSNLAYIALKNNYIRPVVNKGDKIKMLEARHPVIEQTLGPGNFVPNDVYLDKEKNMILVITGPNMAGKSTYIRQIALIVLMAQIGSFIPVKEALIGIVDRIFTRVGASDNLIKGQSTFMVEMNEVANILNNATPLSLLILDEVGRGTSTFDGISIAWAVTEYINENIKAKTLFATHYHELTELSLILPKVKNLSVMVKEYQDEIIFVRKIVEAPADKSYGIQVAQLAGLPLPVIKRAKEILSNFETMEITENGTPILAQTKEEDKNQFNLFETQLEEIRKEIKQLDLANMTPLEALNKLEKIQKKITLNSKDIILTTL